MGSTIPWPGKCCAELETCQRCCLLMTSMRESQLKQALFLLLFCSERCSLSSEQFVVFPWTQRVDINEVPHIMQGRIALIDEDRTLQVFSLQARRLPQLSTLFQGLMSVL